MTSALVQIVDAALSSAVERSGEHLVCRPGCTQCCYGVFPMSQQDAARLRDGLAALERSDPECAGRVRARVAASLERVAPLFPGDPATGVLREGYEEAPLFADEDSVGDSEACPA